jgi:hypothetical protein
MTKSGKLRFNLVFSKGGMQESVETQHLLVAEHMGLLALLLDFTHLKLGVAPDSPLLNFAGEDLHNQVSKHSC